MNKKVILLYVEGETEEEFYKKLKEHLRLKGDNNCNLKVICLRSNTKFANKLICKFKNEIIPTYKDDELIVALCYDSDEYEFGKHPAFNAKEVESNLKKLGADKVIHIIANKTIEDFIMYDEVGVKKFLHLPLKTRVKGRSGLDKIKNLYDKANRTYFKGNKTSGLIDSLDMEKICNKLCSTLSELCCEMNIKCEKCKKSLKK